MLYHKKLATLALLFALIVPAVAKTRKGDQLSARGREAETRKQFDEALNFFEQALSEDPADTGYQLSVNRVRFQAGQRHVELGLKLRAAGKTVEALAEFEKAQAIDPASSIAEQEIRRTRAILDREKKQSVVKPEERGLTQAEIAKKQSDERMDRMQTVPELKPLSSKRIDLKMNNQPVKVLFETVGKLAGINVMFDPDIPAGGKNLSIEINGSTVEEALDYLGTLTKSFWKPLSGNTIFVTQDNTTKRRDYEDQVVKVFYLKNVGTPQELQEIATDVRTICDIRRLFTYNSQMALIVRAEADRVALAEKLIADLDKPKSEVVIDVLVLEHNTDNSHDLGLGLTTGINTSVAYNGAPTTTTTAPTTTTDANGNPVTTPGTTTGTTASSSGAIPLNRIAHLSTGQYSVVLPNAAIQATLSRTNTHVLQSPQVRAANGAKTVLKIGEKVPTASGSFQPGIGGVGINPLVNTQFQFIDVGVNVEITPTIHGNSDEVSLHVDMDISNIDSHVNLGGIDQPVIGQRKVTFDVRMKEGEANVLGGLIQTTQSETMSGTPGLSSIPLIKYFFQNKSIDKQQNELLFVLIPHIVRSQELTETNMRGIASGSDTVVKLNYAPRRAIETAAPAPASTTPASTPGSPLAGPPATAPPPAAPDTTPATLPPAVPAVPSGGSAKVTYMPTRAEGQLGSAITVAVTVDNAADLMTLPLRIKFDPKVVRLNDITAGPLWTSDGKSIAPLSKNILNDTGEASVTVSRTPESGGVTGSGQLLTLVFQSMAKGTTTVTTDFELRDSKLQPIAAGPAPLTITVK